MQRKHEYSTLVPDALAIIAASTNARPMMEVAVALRAIACGAILLPPDRWETTARIAMHLMNSEWNLRAHLTMRHPVSKFFAKEFCKACIRAVPLTPENPTRDLAWLNRFKAVFLRDPALQGHAVAFLNCIKLRVTPAQAMPAQAVPAQTAIASPSPKLDKAQLHAFAKMVAEELVRRRQEEQARVAAQVAVSNTTPAPEPEPPREQVVAHEQPEKNEIIEEAVASAPIASTPVKRRLRNFLRRTRVEDYLPTIQQFEPNSAMAAPQS